MTHRIEIQIPEAVLKASLASNRFRQILIQ